MGEEFISELTWVIHLGQLLCKEFRVSGIIRVSVGSPLLRDFQSNFVGNPVFRGVFFTFALWIDLKNPPTITIPRLRQFALICFEFSLALQLIFSLILIGYNKGFGSLTLK